MVLIFLLVGLSLASSEIPVAYREGLEAYDDNRFEEAKLNFRSFLLSNKEHPLYPDGLYYYARLEKDGEEAKNIFFYLVTNYPDSRWAPHACFMMAKYHCAKEDLHRAGNWFKELISTYPQSDLVDLSENWLRRIERKKKCIKWAVQVGAFQHQANAKKTAVKLRKTEYPVILVKRKGTATTLWLVRVGYYYERNEALIIQGKLEETGYRTYLVQKQCKN